MADAHRQLESTVPAGRQTKQKDAQALAGAFIIDDERQILNIMRVSALDRRIPNFETIELHVREEVE